MGKSDPRLDGVAQIKDGRGRNAAPASLELVRRNAGVTHDGALRSRRQILAFVIGNDD